MRYFLIFIFLIKLKLFKNINSIEWKNYVSNDLTTICNNIDNNNYLFYHHIYIKLNKYKINQLFYFNMYFCKKNYNQY